MINPITFSHIDPITPENPHGYTQIFRTDTNNYTQEDVLHEIEEWTDILHQITGKTPYYYIKVVEFSNRMSSVLACTGRNKGRIFGYVRVNQDYRDYHSNPQTFHNTLCHETIHTFPDAHNHGNVFKSLGRMVKWYVPAVDIGTTSIGDPGYTAHILGKKSQRNGGVIFKYAAICKKCGMKVNRERKCNVINHPERYRCGKCGGQFRIEEYGPNGVIKKGE